MKIKLKDLPVQCFLFVYAIELDQNPERNFDLPLSIFWRNGIHILSYQWRYFDLHDHILTYQWPYFELPVTIFWFTSDHILSYQWRYFDLPVTIFWLTSDDILSYQWRYLELPVTIFWVTNDDILSYHDDI